MQIKMIYRLFGLLTVSSLCACTSGPVLDAPPSLVEASTLPALKWEETGVAIPVYTITNTGGVLSTCHTLFSRPLPDGLKVSVSKNRQNCEITGVPTTLIDPADPVPQDIYAGNRYGLDSVRIFIGGPPPVR